MTKRYTSLADYLERSGETQEQLAARAGVSQAHISRVLHGGHCSLKLAKALSKLTGVPVETFGQVAA
jgi:transcriptional regulator with XRE-family HTH domain